MGRPMSWSRLLWWRQRGSNRAALAQESDHLCKTFYIDLGLFGQNAFVRLANSLYGRNRKHDLH
jgi:hypothetical protein